MTQGRYEGGRTQKRTRRATRTTASLLGNPWNRRMLTAFATTLCFLGMMVALALVQASGGAEAIGESDATETIVTDAIEMETIVTDAAGEIQDECPVSISALSGLVLIGADAEAGVWGYRGDIGADDAWRAVSSAMESAGWSLPSGQQGGAMAVCTRAEPDHLGYSVSIVTVTQSNGATAVTLAFG